MSEIGRILNATVENFKEDILIESFSINSKDIRKNAMFIPLKGNRFDGHDFIDQAIDNGALCFLTQKDVIAKKDCPYLKVDDTLKAMQNLACAYREKRKDLVVIGITGSVGKTTTKEYIYNVLSTTYNTYKNQGNYNNHIGLPYSILNIPDKTEIAVLEMGMSNFGEISFLSKISKPDIGVITNIGVAHIENLKTRYNIFLAKSEIQDGMPSSSLLVINNDNDILHSHRNELKRRVVTIGIENDSDFMAKDIQKAANGFYFVVDSYKYFIETFNFHDIYNSLFAIAVGIILGIDREAIAQGIMKKDGLKRRFEVIKKGDITVIDDTYNASTHSMISAIDSVCNFEGKKILVLGDMLELGSLSEQEHRKVGSYIVTKPIDVVICTGQDAFYIFDQVRKNEKIKSYFVSKEECLDILQKELEGGSVVLFKASRGVKLDELVDNFLRGL
ncbi:UDP-N-acetylmuramoyl-tripeptide--D-alanyl-D-alanine ligase [Caldicellulosiruptor morganii]|uniref:UDP-N-acetylmuramoyl-tripeptide--D-alanyl-D-alanine ligase n=1 Tax=Caldicellulosiruptor morganii TaxID=1387555 RepID=A0ABY7BNH9_9FIRM|nr:UDP-N-acetylmuramoyl-tripeptide--D-alanyl-D-alanine ligase [Caldicellulosiruptor morganii]WAM34398.1 UDP-N-acetylmuramoyl-tripeptide--D-alanyl-D-alanine ligase [Caldicellulosiruptor morganii]